MAAKAGVTIKFRKNLAGLTKFSSRIDGQVRQALNQVAYQAQKHAREDHPKSPAEKGVSINLDRFRKHTGPTAGPFAGLRRYFTDTGLLNTSIQVRRARLVGTDFISRIVSGVDYSEDVEFGDMSENRPPYPFMRPAAISVEGYARRQLALALRGALP